MTTTDTMWTNRLSTIMPDNFMTNVSGSFAVSTGILDTMINRIGMTVCQAVDNAFNPFAKYTKTIMDYGDTIQEYKQKYITGDEPDFSPSSPNPFGIKTDKPIAQYEKYNDAVQYKQTIYDNQLKLAFTSEQKFGDFVANQMATMQESDALDKFIKWKKYMSNGSIAGQKYTLANDPTTGADFAKEFIKKSKDIIADFKLPNTIYNVNQDLAISSGVDLIMRRKDKNVIDEYLSGVYNMDKLDIDANIIYIDDFATVTGETNKELIAVIADDRAFSYYPRTPQGGALYNPEGLYTNYWLTVQGIYTVSKYRNIVQIYDDTTA